MQPPELQLEKANINFGPDHKKINVHTPSRRPRVTEQSQKLRFVGVAMPLFMLHFTQYKSAELTTLSSHYLAALPTNDVCASPIATEGFGGLSHPNKAPSPPKLKQETL